MWIWDWNRAKLVALDLNLKPLDKFILLPPQLSSGSILSVKFIASLFKVLKFGTLDLLTKIEARSLVNFVRSIFGSS